MKADILFGALANKEFVLNWWKRKDAKEREYGIGILANATTVPCINIVYWIAELEGWPDYLKDNADSLSKFYGYTHIANKPEGCPWP